MVEKLQVLKRKADESISEELAASNVCKRRLDHLKEHVAIASSSSVSTGTLNNYFLTCLNPPYHFNVRNYR